MNEDGTYSTGAVAFDYSAYSATSDNYANLRGEYETLLINQYKKALESKDLLDRIDTKNETVIYFENLVKELIEKGELSQEDVKNVDEYNALYYTYTLYDSDAYEPFNANTAADGETGYDYKISDYDETLGFFTYKNEEENSYNVFADYSAVNKNIEKTTADDGGDDDTDKDENPTNFWLYIASIILVVALLITLVSLLLRDVLKKRRRTKSEKSMQKNNYRQRKRYIRKLHLVENEDATDGETDAEETAENDETEETVEDTVDEAVEEAPATDDATTEDTTDGENSDDAPVDGDTDGGETNE